MYGQHFGMGCESRRRKGKTWKKKKKEEEKEAIANASIYYSDTYIYTTTNKPAESAPSVSTKAPGSN